MNGDREAVQLPPEIWKAIESFQNGVLWYAGETGNREPSRREMERRKARLHRVIAASLRGADVDVNGFTYSRDCLCSWCRGYFAEKDAATEPTE